MQAQKNQHEIFLRAITDDKLQAVAQHIRGRSQAQGNCVHLARAVLSYLATGELPQPAAISRPSTRDFAVVTAQAPKAVKLEPQDSGRPSGWVVSSTIVNTGVLDDFIPAQPKTWTEQAGVVELLDAPAIDLTQFRQLAIDASSVGDRLRRAAASTGSCHYGCINLARPSGGPGHCLVYFATASDVFFIDPQRINKGIGRAVEATLSATVNISDGGASTAYDFQSRVFVVPCYPANALSALNQPTSAQSPPVSSSVSAQPPDHRTPKVKRSADTQLQAPNNKKAQFVSTPESDVPTISSGPTTSIESESESESESREKFMALLHLYKMGVF